MAFTAQTFDGVAAAQRMIDFRTNVYHECMGVVAQAIKGDESSNDPGYYTTAIRGWVRTPSDRRHSPDGDIPPGMAFYFATANIPDGHVVITLGGRRVVTTDWPARTIGIATIEQLVAEWNLTPLGWTDWFLGHNLRTPTATPQPKGDMDMIYLEHIDPEQHRDRPPMLLAPGWEKPIQNTMDGRLNAIGFIDSISGTKLMNADDEGYDNVRDKMRGATITPLSSPALAQIKGALTSANATVKTSITLATKAILAAIKK